MVATSQILHIPMGLADLDTVTGTGNLTSALASTSDLRWSPYILLVDSAIQYGSFLR